MLVQIYMKNEPLVACDLLIAREDANLTIPMSELPRLQEADMEIILAKPQEHIGMKAAVAIADTIRGLTDSTSFVQILCPDKSAMEGICSMEYMNASGSPVRCTPVDTKVAQNQAMRTKPRAKKPAAAPELPQTPDAGASELMKDPELVSGNEMALGSQSTAKPAEPDPTMANMPKIMKILKDCHIPPNQLPGVLEAVREIVTDPGTPDVDKATNIIQSKLTRDGTTNGLAPNKIAKLLLPYFDELRTLLKQIDDHNDARQNS